MESVRGRDKSSERGRLLRDRLKKASAIGVAEASSVQRQATTEDARIARAKAWGALHGDRGEVRYIGTTESRHPHLAGSWPISPVSGRSWLLRHHWRWPS